jgi:hypothetical protein
MTVSPVRGSEEELKARSPAAEGGAPSTSAVAATTLKSPFRAPSRNLTATEVLDPDLGDYCVPCKDWDTVMGYRPAGSSSPETPSSFPRPGWSREPSDVDSGHDMDQETCWSGHLSPYLDIDTDLEHEMNFFSEDPVDVVIESEDRPDPWCESTSRPDVDHVDVYPLHASPIPDLEEARSEEAPAITNLQVASPEVVAEEPPTDPDALALVPVTGIGMNLLPARFR